MHVVLFDIDGTLIHTDGAGRLAMHDALHGEFGVERPAEVSFSGRTDRGLAHEFFAHHTIPDTPDNWRRFIGRYLERLDVRLAERQGAVLPGVADVLARLGERGDVLVGLLTGNVRAGAERKLRHFALETHFRCGGFGDEPVDRDDVARVALREVRRMLNVDLAAERIWVVGDTTLDVRCARAIGARAVAVATGGIAAAALAAAQPDLLLDDLTQAARWLDRLAPA